MDPNQFIQNTILPQSASFNVEGSGAVGSLVVGPVQSPEEKLEVEGNAKVSDAVFAGRAFGSDSEYQGINSSNTNVVYGQIWRTGTLAPGATSPTFNLNGLSQPAASIGLLLILFSGSENGGSTQSSYRAIINAHGVGFNDFAPLAERDDPSYAIQGGIVDVSFKNNSAAEARYTIKVVPFIIHDPPHAGL